MNHLMKDKRAAFITASIAVNIAFMYMICFGNFSGLGEIGRHAIYFTAAVILLLMGEMDVLRNYERRTERFQLAVIRWVTATAFLCAISAGYIFYLYVFFANTLIWWAMLLVVINVMYSGYFAPIRRWMAFLPVAGGVAAAWFASEVSDTMGLIMTEILIIIPLLLLIRINLKYYRHLQTRMQRAMAAGYILFAVVMVLAELIFIELNLTGKEEYIYVAYNSCFSILLVMFTLLISFNIAVKEGVLLKNYKYTLIMAAAFGCETAFLYLIFRDIKGIAIGVLMSMFLVLVQEFAMMLFKSGKAYEEHKGVVARYNHDIEQKKKMADFLHDEILQDLYAVKLLLEVQESGADEAKNAVGLLIDKVRREMEGYSIRLEKSISYKENINAMLELVKKRYPGSSIKTVLVCEEELSLFKPVDELVYVITRELVTNVYKHSNGDLCRIFIQESGEYLILEVEDNGTLNEGEHMPEGTEGHGIHAIRENLELYGNRISFEKSSLGGRKVRVTIKNIVM
ncbi:MAG: sensor histidine kinase [Anaerovoracaceae bacterium]